MLIMIITMIIITMNIILTEDGNDSKNTSTMATTIILTLFATMSEEGELTESLYWPIRRTFLSFKKPACLSLFVVRIHGFDSSLLFTRHSAARASELFLPTTTSLHRYSGIFTQICGTIFTIFTVPQRGIRKKITFE